MVDVLTPGTGRVPVGPGGRVAGLGPVGPAAVAVAPGTGAAARVLGVAVPVVLVAAGVRPALDVALRGVGRPGLVLGVAVLGLGGLDRAGDGLLAVVRARGPVGPGRVRGLGRVVPAAVPAAVPAGRRGVAGSPAGGPGTAIARKARSRTGGGLWGPGGMTRGGAIRSAGRCRARAATIGPAGIDGTSAAGVGPARAVG
ncbi:hypothetical protein GCM10009742_80710 [Kribbella karoonensis]|uniref:Uncharacterized protein n=1 Tax=Kribbella karoonensis TaxID=324851 RepID=A0ABP4QN77_9ACTN